ncbi:hypothetical protein D1920_14445 [Rhodopseudomonas palustris]|nr:hypothetical protein D1920_14445 [Rhodopseudomonas palustris]
MTCLASVYNPLSPSFRGARSASPESILTRDAVRARRCIAAAEYKRRWLWIPGLRAGGAHPGMTRGEDVVSRCSGHANRPPPVAAPH